MADSGTERTSFVNEAFDDLVSESSDTSLKKQEQEGISQENQYATLESVTVDQEPKPETQSVAPPIIIPISNHHYEMPSHESLGSVMTERGLKSETQSEPHYDMPTTFGPYYDEPVRRDPRPDPPQKPPPKLPVWDTPTLALEEGGVVQGFPSPSHEGGATIAPSRIVARGNGLHDDEVIHRPLPPSEEKYEIIPDSLRGTTEEDSLFDLQVN